MIKHLKDNRKLFASRETLTCILSTDNHMGCYTSTPGIYVVQSIHPPLQLIWAISHFISVITLVSPSLHLSSIIFVLNGSLKAAGRC